MKHWKPIVATMALALSVGLLLAAGPGKGEKSASKGETTALKGKPAPEFTSETLDGKKVALSGEKGNVVLMDYWATWCPPCVKGLPHINELANDKSLTDRGLKVWAINSNETKDKVEPFLKKHELNMTVPMDKGDFGTAYMVRGIPTTVIVGRDGNIKEVFIGFMPGSEAKIKAAVEAALDEPAPPKAS